MKRIDQRGAALEQLARDLPGGEATAVIVKAIARFIRAEASLVDDGDTTLRYHSYDMSDRIDRLADEIEACGWNR